MALYLILNCAQVGRKKMHYPQQCDDHYTLTEIPSALKLPLVLHIDPVIVTAFSYPCQENQSVSHALLVLPCLEGDAQV